jgi:hypothetical protein
MHRRRTARCAAARSFATIPIATAIVWRRAARTRHAALPAMSGFASSAPNSILSSKLPLPVSSQVEKGRHPPYDRPPVPSVAFSYALLVPLCPAVLAARVSALPHQPKFHCIVVDSVQTSLESRVGFACGVMQRRRLRTHRGTSKP